MGQGYVEYNERKVGDKNETTTGARSCKIKEHRERGEGRGRNRTRTSRKKETRRLRRSDTRTVKCRTRSGVFFFLFTRVPTVMDTPNKKNQAR
jgi:hypothetical protein